MKLWYPAKHVVARLFLFFWFLTVGLFAAGCASAGAGDPSLKVIQMNVGWKMDGYRQAGLAGQFTQNQQEQVATAYATYQKAFQQALNASKGNLDVPATLEVRQAADQLFAALGAL